MKKKLSLLTFPWLAMISIALAYGLLGWRLSFLTMLGLVESWIATITIIFLLIWRGGILRRWFRLGPTVLVSILVASFTLVVAIAYSDLFGLALVLVLSIFWGRLELQSWGMNQRLVLVCVSLMSGVGLTLGWIIGHNPGWETILFQWRS
jgi:hypothetical protein